MPNLGKKLRHAARNVAESSETEVKYVEPTFDITHDLRPKTTPKKIPGPDQFTSILMKNTKKGPIS